MATAARQSRLKLGICAAEASAQAETWNPKVSLGLALSAGALCLRPLSSAVFLGTLAKSWIDLKHLGLSWHPYGMHSKTIIK